MGAEGAAVTSIFFLFCFLALELSASPPPRTGLGASGVVLLKFLISFVFFYACPIEKCERWARQIERAVSNVRRLSSQ